jgi:O-antigen/teichoic acid export membrane protein
MKQSMARGSLISLSIRMLDLPFRYGFHLLIAASLAVTDTGRFYIVFSFMTALAGFGRLGIDQALTRQLAMDVACDRHETTRASIWHALRLVLLASSVAALLLAVGASYLASEILNKPDLAFPLILGALTLIPQNVGAVFAGALAGLHRVGFSQAIYSWLWPAIFCLITLPAVITGTLTVNMTLILIAVSFMLAAVTGGLLLWHVLSKQPSTAQPGQSPPALFRPGLSLFTLEINKLLLATAPAIVLGIYATAHDVGLFALAWRIALIVNLLISAVTAMAVPRFAALHAKSDRDGMEQNAAQAIGIVLCIALPITICMLIFPQTLLSLFGEGYGDGATILRILAIGQIAAVCFTALPELLGMTSHMAELSRLNAVTVIVMLVGLAILVPLDSARGAALTIAFAVFLNGAIATWQVQRLLGVRPHQRLWHTIGCRLLRSKADAMVSAQETHRVNRDRDMP